ncbi:MAG: DUF3795 domain-containing protein [Promethearchaeota archaeon]|jgi:hypothetical protein
MEKIIAYCGLNCSDCSAYKATQKDDYPEIKKVAKQWSNETMSFKPEEIYCDGCNIDRRLFSWCNDCPTRKCCRDKQIENCAYCEDYFCDNLKLTFDNDPSAKERLDEIRKKL